jgi:hypothetical protein
VSYFPLALDFPRPAGICHYCHYFNHCCPLSFPRIKKDLPPNLIRSLNFQTSNICKLVSKPSCISKPELYLLSSLCASPPALPYLWQTRIRIARPSLTALSLQAGSLIPIPSLEDHLHLPLPIVQHKSRSLKTFALRVPHTVAAALVLDRSADLPALQPAQLPQSAVSIPMG